MTGAWRHNGAHRHTWRVAWALVLTVALLCGLWPVRGLAADASRDEDAAVSELATDGTLAAEAEVEVVHADEAAVAPLDAGEPSDVQATSGTTDTDAVDDGAEVATSSATEQTSLAVDGVDGVTITGELPVGASADAQEVSTTVEGTLDGMDVLAAYDITLYDAQDEACEPDAPVQVTVEDARIAEALAAGNEVLVYYVPDDASASPEPMAVVAAEGSAVTFEAPHFSTYVMVTPTEPSPDPVAVAATELNDKWLVMSVSGRYLTTASVNGSPAGLGKTDNVQKAPAFHFEAANTPSDGTYYISVMVDGQTKYLDFSIYSNESATLQLVDEKSQVFTVAYDDEGSTYVISGEDGGSTYYINQFNGTRGNRFAGWNEIDSNCHFAFGERTRDPLGLDKKEYVIVNIQNVAMLSERHGTSGLEGIAVTRETDGGSTLFNAGDGTNLPLWLFEAQDDGTYYISTEVNGEKQYLNISAFEPASDRSVSLSTTAQRISIEYYDGAIRFVNPDDAKGAAVDLYNKGTVNQQFSVWNVVNNNEKFYLGQPYAQTVIYKYPKAANDQHTPQDLPSYSMDTWGTGETTYTVKGPSQTTYYSQDEEKRYTYSFTHWVDDDGTIYRPSDSINVEGRTTPLSLSACWSGPTETDIPVTVHYVIEQQNQQQSNVSSTAQTLVGTLPTTTSGVTTEEKSGVYAENYTVRNLVTPYYQTETTRFIFTYEFVGWTTESGALIEAESVVGENLTIDLLRGEDAYGQPYDQNGDGTVTLTAEWTSKYENPNNKNYTARSVYFFVLKNASAEDLFVDGGQIDTSQGNYTQKAVYGTIMEPGVSAPDTNSGDWNVIVDQSWSGWGVLKADRAIRSLGEDGYTYDDGTTYKTLTFPTDEEVLASLIANGETLYYKDSAGVSGVIQPADLTPENYTIRWYVTKLQSDGWHIDGKLTARVHYVTISKTFSGDEAAVAKALANDSSYNITLDATGDTTDNKAPYKLVLTDKTGGTVEDGYLGAEGDYSKYGYVRRSGNTFTWVVRVADESTYKVTENDYAVMVGDETYGISAQYSVTNAGEEDVALTRWASDIYATSKKYAKDEADLSSFRATNIFNTYIPTGTFVIQKRDNDTASTPMPGVQFAVYDEAGQQMKLSKADDSTATDGKYTVLYENGSVSDVAQTGTDGNIYLTLPKPETGTYTFEIRETVPQGYLGYGAETPRFRVTVDPDGVYTVSDREPGQSSIEPTTIGTPGSTQSEVSGASVINKPQTTDISVTKTWECDHEDSVTMTLTGAAGDTTKTYTIVLNEGNNWTYTWEDLPLMLGNEYVDYSVQETKINNYEIGSDAFSHWIPQYIRPVYKDSAGEQLAYASDTSTKVAEADKYKVATIAYEVRNDEQDKDDVTIKLHKTDSTDATKNLDGAKFQIYEARDDGAIDLPYGSGTVKVKDNGYVETRDGMDLKFHNNRDYYLREIDPPEGYEVIEGLIKISVSAAGEITLETESGKEVSQVGRVTLTQTNLVATLTVADKPKPTSLKVTKEVTGAYGDKTKQFGFTVTLPAGTDSLTGTITRAAGTTEDVTFTSANLAFTLADGEYLVIEGIDVNKEIAVSEDEATGYTPTVTAALDEGTQGETSTTANSATVTMATGGGSATVEFTNAYGAVPPTGLLSGAGPWALLAGLAAGALAMALAADRRRKLLG